MSKAEASLGLPVIYRSRVTRERRRGADQRNITSLLNIRISVTAGHCWQIVKYGQHEQLFIEHDILILKLYEKKEHYRYRFARIVPIFSFLRLYPQRNDFIKQLLHNRNLIKRRSLLKRTESISLGKLNIFWRQELFPILPGMHPDLSLTFIFWC